jgi:hypothetical protein
MNDRYTKVACLPWEECKTFDCDIVNASVALVKTGAIQNNTDKIQGAKSQGVRLCGGEGGLVLWMYQASCGWRVEVNLPYMIQLATAPWLLSYFGPQSTGT